MSIEEHSVSNRTLSQLIEEHYVNRKTFDQW